MKPNIELILDFTNESLRKTRSRLENFLQTDCITYSKKKAQIYKKYKIDNSKWFNIFESISDKWYRENFHSDILYTILNPETPQIGTRLFLQEFVKFLGIEDKFDCNKPGLKVIKEQPTGKIKYKKKDKKGYIDILIENESQAIIIENKINYAPDMENQLVRYMAYVKENRNILTYTVVYLTLKNDINKKPPPVSSYDKSFEDYAKQLEKTTGILKEVYAVAPDSDKCLARDFLPVCSSIAAKNTNDIIGQVYIDQYRILLNHLGGNAYMAEDEKELIKHIFSNAEKLEDALDFISIWENRNEVEIRNSDAHFIETIQEDKEKKTAADEFYDIWSRHEILLLYALKDLVIERIKDQEFNTFCEEKQSGIRKDFGDLYVCFYVQEDNPIDWGFGFLRHNVTQKVFESKRNKLKKILEGLKQSKVFKPKIYSKSRTDHDWVCIQLVDAIEIENNKILLPEIADTIVSHLNDLCKKYES